MCQILQITYTSLGVTGQSTIVVPGVNFDGTYYEYYFNTSYFSGTFQTAIWRIRRNPAVPQWELDIFVGNNWLLAKGIAPDATCPLDSWTTPGTEIIDIIKVSEYTLEDNCTIWTAKAIPNLGCCSLWEDAIFYIDPLLEEHIHPGQYLEDFYNPSANPAPTSITEYQGIRILTLVYLKNNCVHFGSDNCNGGTFIGVILIDSKNNIIRNKLFTTLTFIVDNIPRLTFNWNQETLNCKKLYTFSSDWSGSFINYRLFWVPDASIYNYLPLVPPVPVGTPGWILEEEGSVDPWIFTGFLSTESISPVGTYLTGFQGAPSRCSFVDSTLPITGVFCVCEKPEPIDNCFELSVWEKQCEFAKCVLKYLQALNFGNANCETLENLKLEKRTLEILNNYDSRDIPNDTMDYNNISYSDIKKLLN